MRPADANDPPARRLRKVAARSDRPAAAGRGRKAPAARSKPPEGDEAAVVATTQEVLAVLAAFGLED